MRLRPSGNAPGIRAGIYCRISRAQDGDFTKTDDQEHRCRDHAETLSWPIAEGVGHPLPNGVYTDHSKSAWELNRKRPAWDQMLDDIEAGKINAVVIYHGDRLIGRPEDLKALLDVARSRGTRLASPTGDRDLSSADDEFIMWIEAAMKGRESANISRRRKMQYARWRREGRVRAGGRGGRVFGFDTAGLSLVPPCRCDVATREEHSEEEIIREMAARVLAGESSSGIARDLTARGWRTPSGTDMSQTFVRRLLARPRYAGLMPDGESAAAWPAILGRETWERVCLALDQRSVMNPAPTSARRWLLSGIAECGPCGRPVQIGISSHDGHGHGYASYSCLKGHTRRDAEHLDAYVAARTVRLLNDPRQPEGELPVPAGHAAEWARLTDERAATAKSAKDYAASPGRVDILMSRLDSIDARMAELREREAGDARSRLLGHHRGITAAQFAALPLDVRRALVAGAFRITVLPASGRGPGFRTEDVRLEPL